MSSFKHINRNKNNDIRFHGPYNQHRIQQHQLSNIRQPNSLKLQRPMEEMIDFATTACNRPEIIEKTYYSLQQAIRGINLKECRLFINIDPMPNADNIEDNVRVAKKYFGEVIWNTPKKDDGSIADKGSFPNAFKWCIYQVSKPYCFYIQDDWLFAQTFHIGYLIKMVNTNPRIASVNLYKTDGGSSLPRRIYLSPSLFKTGHFKKIALMLVPNYSPEKQLRPFSRKNNPYGGRILAKLGYYGVCYRKNYMPMVRDLGRPWMKDNGLEKSRGAYNNFQSWKTVR